VLSSRVRRIASVVACVGAACYGSLVIATTAFATPPTQIELVEKHVDDVRDYVQLLLWPIGILLAVLTIGGALSVVFSIRDQRRISQLHELAVTGELGSQRRSEQSFSSFLDESQKTLTLVNDTLGLAKDASDRATRTTELNATAQLDRIEEDAEELMGEVFDSVEFTALTDGAVHRTQLVHIAGELRDLEGFLRVHEIEIPYYSRFVKAIDQFLRGDTKGALTGLQRASQEAPASNLRRSILFWIGYLHSTIGGYEPAIRAFRDDEVDLARGEAQRSQLERIILECRFFRAAAQWEDAGRDGCADEPRERLHAVATVLEELRDLAALVGDSESDQHRLRRSHEIARTRADALTWVAFDPQQRHTGDSTQEQDAPHPSRSLQRARALQKTVSDAPLTALADSSARALSSPEEYRMWALVEAYDICDEHVGTADLHVSFARAECLYLLDEREQAKRAFERVEFKLASEYGHHREPRVAATLGEVALICRCRLLELTASKDERWRRNEEGQVREAYKRASDAVREIRQPNVTIFSQIERRNRDNQTFTKEIHDILHQAHLDRDEHGELVL
jgi:tetratricopeptide (TPR) repeat protein